MGGMWRSAALAIALMACILRADAVVPGAVVASPALAPDAPFIKMVAAGSKHFAALDRDGRVWVWGDNSRGQLGLGNDREIAALANGIPISRDRPGVLNTGYVFVAAHGDSTMAIKADGSLWGWGAGVPGLEIRKTYWRPTRVTWLKVREVHLGSYFAFVRDTDDNLWRLGNPGDLESPDAPIPSYYCGEVMQVAVHGEHAAVLLKDHTLWTYGTHRAAAALGRSAGTYPDLVQVGADDFLSATTDAHLTLLKKRDGSTVLFGEAKNLAPALDKDIGAERHPTPALAPYRAVFHYQEQYAGTRAVYLLKESGQLDLVQIDHDEGRATASALRTIDRDYVSIASGDDLLIGIKRDGSTWAWGHGYPTVPGIDDRSDSIILPQRVIFPSVTF